MRLQSLFLPLVLSGPALSAPLKVACIGNSITAGFGIPEAERSTKSYPAVLQKMLGSGYVVNNYGVSGTTLLKLGSKPYWNQSAYANSRAWLPDIVIIQLGTNDANPKNSTYWKDFQADYLEMVSSFRNLSSHPRMYLNLPPAIYLTKPTDASDTALVKYILPPIREAARLTGSQVIDVHAATSGKPDLFPDKLHPDEFGAALIAETVYQAFLTTALLPAPPEGWSVRPLALACPGTWSRIRPDGREIAPTPLLRDIAPHLREHGASR